MDNVNPNAVGLTPYAPGKPIEELTRELGITDVVKLASNENPRGPGEGVRRRLQEAAGKLSRYPDGSGYALKRRLAEHHAAHGIDPAQLTLGNGSNDVIELVARAVLTPGSEVVVPQHAFVAYRLATATCGGRLVVVPARKFGADLHAMLAAVTDRTRLVCLANPNNPTGTWVTAAELTAFLQALPAWVWMLLDEAYFDYVTVPDYPNGLDLLQQHPNLVVTRTFSKIHGLAALRVGYGVSHGGLADLMNRVRQPFNCNAMALAAAEAALDDTAFVRDSRELNTVGQAQLTAGLEARRLDFIPSAGNFVTVAVADAAGVYDRLLHEGVIVRPVAEYELPGHLRVTVGAEAENERFLAALARVS